MLLYQEWEIKMDKIYLVDEYEKYNNEIFEWDDLLSKIRTDGSKQLIIDGYKYTEEIDGKTYFVQDYVLVNDKDEEKKIKIKEPALEIIFK